MKMYSSRFKELKVSRRRVKEFRRPNAEVKNEINCFFSGYQNERVSVRVYFVALVTVSTLLL